jgi:hypothetical protein
MHPQFAPSLSSLLRMRAPHEPAQIGYRILGEDGREIESHRAIDTCAQAMLQSERCRKAGRHSWYSTCGEFITAFFRRLYVGAVAVPLSLPHSRGLQSLDATFSNVRSSAILTNRTIETRLSGQPADASSRKPGGGLDVVVGPLRGRSTGGRCRRWTIRRRGWWRRECCVTFWAWSVRVHDNFFELGVHSLPAMRAMHGSIRHSVSSYRCNDEEAAPLLSKSKKPSHGGDMGLALIGNDRGGGK